jgi:lipopolysaccharide biosynthesis glycosyltransferase
MGRIPLVMWYRVFLPELLPSADRVLYLDADTLVVAPLSPLWDEPLDGSYLAAVSNVLEPQYAARPAELGLPATQAYFNSGVLLFNLDAMRADRCTHEILRVARDEKLLWPDQDALNVVLGARRVALHPRWNCMNSLYLLPEAYDTFPRDVVDDACRRPAIVHFEGPKLAKPWHYLSKHPYRGAYEHHRRNTPWPDVAVEGRTWRNRLLRPLPTRTTITLLGRSLELRSKVRRRVSALRANQ